MGHFKNRTKEDYIEAAKNSASITQMCKNLGLIPAGGNFATIQKKIVEYELDVSHFLGQAHNRGKIFVDSPTNRIGIKKKLIRERGHQCQSCMNIDWLGKPITLEVEHVDGNSTNNEDDNLLLLCPNCHSQTPTWRRAKSSFEPNPRTTCECGNRKGYNAQRCLKCHNDLRSQIAMSSGVSPKSTSLLCSCGNTMSKGANQCSECLHKAQERIVWPAPDELATRLRTTSYTALGRELGVSDNAIRKYLRKHGYDTKTLQQITPA